MNLMLTTTMMMESGDDSAHITSPCIVVRSISAKLEVESEAHRVVQTESRGRGASGEDASIRGAAQIGASCF